MDFWNALKSSSKTELPVRVQEAIEDEMIFDAAIDGISKIDYVLWDTYLTGQTLHDLLSSSQLKAIHAMKIYDAIFDRMQGYPSESSFSAMHILDDMQHVRDEINDIDYDFDKLRAGYFVLDVLRCDRERALEALKDYTAATIFNMLEDKPVTHKVGFVDVEPLRFFVNILEDRDLFEKFRQYGPHRLNGACMAYAACLSSHFEEASQLIGDDYVAINLPYAESLITPGRTDSFAKVCGTIVTYAPLFDAVNARLTYDASSDGTRIGLVRFCVQYAAFFQHAANLLMDESTRKFVLGKIVDNPNTFAEDLGDPTSTLVQFLTKNFLLHDITPYALPLLTEDPKYDNVRLLFVYEYAMLQLSWEEAQFFVPDRLVGRLTRLLVGKPKYRDSFDNHDLIMMMTNLGMLYYAAEKPQLMLSIASALGTDDRYAESRATIFFKYIIDDDADIEVENALKTNNEIVQRRLMESFSKNVLNLLNPYGIRSMTRRLVELSLLKFMPKGSIKLKQLPDVLLGMQSSAEALGTQVNLSLLNHILGESTIDNAELLRRGQNPSTQTWSQVLSKYQTNGGTSFEIINALRKKIDSESNTVIKKRGL